VNRISLIRPIAVTLAAMALSACALLATPEPVQTYRFGEAAPAASAALSVASPTEVTLRRVEFPQAVEGDRLLGVPPISPARAGCRRRRTSIWRVSKTPLRPRRRGSA